MSTEFEDLTRLAFAESLTVTGTVHFRIRTLNREGSISDLTEEEKFEMGQIVPHAVATLEFAAERFQPSLVNGEKVYVTRRGTTETYRVGKVTGDEVSIQLLLANPNE